MERRLAAILAADAVGYSRLMGEDEAGTLNTLMAYRADCIDPRIAAHNGRIVKTTGDGLLAEFPSVVEAVSCALEIQSGLAARNDAARPEQRIRFRIGINVGDVIVEGGDIYGDGVNVAARLEGLAEPGGICLSRAARDQIRDKLDIVLDDLGEVEVKNIARPVRAFRVAVGGAAARPSGSGAPRKSRRWRLSVAAAVLLVAVAAVASVRLYSWRSDATVAARTGQVGIAVLPFANMSGDPAQEYFSDGITEDLISDLSRISGLFVIARSTMFTYKGKSVGAGQVGRELDVPYVLEGSIRKAGGRVRVNASLIDTAKTRPLWSERYDRDLTGVFALQDEVTSKIVAALAVQLTKKEADRLSKGARTNPEAYDTMLRGLAELRRYTPDTNARAQKLFRTALAHDPSYARAYAALGYSYAVGIIFGWSRTPDEDGRRALELIATAEKLDSTLPQVYFARSNAYRAQRRLDEAIDAARRAIALDPNYADAYAALAITLNYAGKPREGIDAIRKSMRLNPRYGFFEVWVLAQGFFVLERYDEAIAELRKVVSSNPSFVQGHKLLAAAFGQSGRIDDAAWEKEEVLSLLPNFSAKAERARAPYRNPALDRYIDGLRKAGLPD